MKALDILKLLPGMILDDDRVDARTAEHIFYPRIQRIDDAELSPFDSVLIRGDAHDEPVSQGFGALQQAHVSFVEQIEHTVRNNRFHTPSNSLRYSL